MTSSAKEEKEEEEEEESQGVGVEGGVGVGLEGGAERGVDVVRSQRRMMGPAPTASSLLTDCVGSRESRGALCCSS